MSLTTPICDRLGIELPIFGFAHSLEVTAAISEAGGLGVYGATRDTPEEIEERLAALHDRLRDRPFGVDLVLPRGMPDFDDREAIEAEIPEDHRRWVADLAERYDVPPATGPGAHTGVIGTMSLVPQIVDISGEVPVLAAGGIATGRQLAASLALGAQGVWLGTAWLATVEHELDEILVDKLLAAGSSDTVVSRADSGKTLRQIRTAWSDEWSSPGAPAPLRMPYQDILVGDLLGAIHEHRVEPLMHHPAGQSIAFVKERKTVAAVIDDLAREARDALASLKKSRRRG